LVTLKARPAVPPRVVCEQLISPIGIRPCLGFPESVNEALEPDAVAWPLCVAALRRVQVPGGVPLGPHDIDAARVSMLKHGLGEFRK
jgi:hypothetical protein